MINFNNITDVVKHLLIINVIIYIAATTALSSYQGYLPLSYPTMDSFEPFQIITHMFMHGSTQHLMFNMLSLFFLGPMVEQKMGSKKFFIFYMICGMGSMLLHMAMVYFGQIEPYIRVLGASGAIMGVFVAFAMYFPNMKLMLLFPPIPVKAKYLVIGLIAFDLFSGMTSMNTGIAHFAHIGGAIAGFILITMWGKGGQNSSNIQRWN